MNALSIALVAAALLVQPLHGHSWIEQLININDKGEYVGNFGYTRNFRDKGAGGGSWDYLIPPAGVSPPWIAPEHALCSNLQKKPEQADNFPRLQTTPGSFIALRYSENGHVSDPDQTPGRGEGSGTVFIYGTTQPIEDEKLVNVLQWTKDGSGGDKRGVLLAAQNYDDGRCYENKPGNPIVDQRQKKFPNFALGQAGQGPGNYPLFCESNVQVPKDAPSGKPYTMYWVWQWNQAANKDPSFPQGRDEYYTSCFDVDVVESLKMDAFDAKNKVAQQDANTKAVSDFKSRTAVQPDAIKGEMGPVFKNMKIEPPASTPAPAQSSAAQAPSSAAQTTPAQSAPASSAQASVPAASSARASSARAPSAPASAPARSAPASSAPAALPSAPAALPSAPAASSAPAAPPAAPSVPAPPAPKLPAPSTFATSIARGTPPPASLPAITPVPAPRPGAPAPEDDQLISTVTELRTVTAGGSPPPAATSPSKRSAKFRGRLN